MMIARSMCAGLVVAAALAAGGRAQDDVLQGSAAISDGRILRGEIELDAPGRFCLFDPRSKRRYRLAPADVARLIFSVEREELVQGWMFQEESRNTKIKLAFWRPVRELGVSVILRSGQRLYGHLDAAVLHLWEDLGAEDREHRLVLGSHQRGEKGQKLEELLWCRELVLGKAAPRTKFATLKVCFIPPGQSRLISLRQRVSYGPARGAPGLFKGLLPGEVALFHLAGATLWAGWPGDARAPAPGRLRAVEEKIADVEEFFDEKKVLAARVEGAKGVVALVQSRRLGRTTYADRKVARWDLYVLEEVDRGAWEIRQRLFLFRRVGEDKGVALAGVSRVVPLARLAAIALPAAGGEVDLKEIRL